MPESLQLFCIGMVLTSPLWAVVFAALVIQPLVEHCQTWRRQAHKPAKVERCCEHDYQWMCTFCGRWYKNHKPTCGLRQLFQQCRTCGIRGPNGGY
jgi:hypothetical protein